MSSRNRRFGCWAEERAVRFLEQAGFRILEANYRCRSGEIDLVAMEGPVLVFIEVKARHGVGYGTPAASVHAAKRARIRRVACAYLAERKPRAPRVRFDVVSIIVPRGSDRPSIELMRSAFEA